MTETEAHEIYFTSETFKQVVKFSCTKRIQSKINQNICSNLVKELKDLNCGSLFKLNCGGQW